MTGPTWPTGPDDPLARVVVVDDHPVFRRGLVALLRAHDLEVVGEAASGTEAVDVVSRTSPDVVLMDLGLPDLSGTAATERITASSGTRVLVVTMFDDPESVRAALAAGAAGYVTKESSPEHVVAAVHAVRMGAQWLGEGVPRPGPDDVPRTSAEVPGLTPRESAVADLLSRGLPNPVIAERLGLSTKTVANYVSAVLLRLGATDRADAVRRVREHRGG